jgi:hypothetical protein
MNPSILLRAFFARLTLLFGAVALGLVVSPAIAYDRVVVGIAVVILLLALAGMGG